MFHSHLWKTLTEVAAAGCNARVFTLNFLLNRNKIVPRQGDPELPPDVEERKP